MIGAEETTYVIATNYGKFAYRDEDEARNAFANLSWPIGAKLYRKTQMVKIDALLGQPVAIGEAVLTEMKQSRPCYWCDTLTNHKVSMSFPVEIVVEYMCKPCALENGYL